MTSTSPKAPDRSMSALDRFKYQPNATRKPQQAAKVKKEPHAKPRAPGRKRRTRAFAAATTSTTPKLEPDRKRQHRTTAAAAAAAVAASGAPAATSKTTVKHEDVPLPFVAAPFGSPYRDRFSSTCEACFEAHAVCAHYPVHRLRLLLVGHNPSIHAWGSGFPYSNPTNNMLKLLRGTLHERVQWEGLVPKNWQLKHMNSLAAEYGIGVADIGTERGNDANAYSRKVMLQWREWFYKRLRHYMAQVREGMGPARVATTASTASSAGGAGGGAGAAAASSTAAPAVVAFTGKRQFSWLFEPPLKRCSLGVQTKLPPGWPLPSSTEVWVLTSSSGRAAMTLEARAAPYRDLASRLRKLGPWTPVKPNEKSRSVVGASKPPTQ